MLPNSDSHAFQNCQSRGTDTKVPVAPRRALSRLPPDLPISAAMLSSMRARVLPAALSGLRVRGVRAAATTSATSLTGRGLPAPSAPATATTSPTSADSGGGGAVTPLSVLGVPLSQEVHGRSLLDALSLENASAPEARAVRKREIVERFRRAESDTGSPEVQSMFFSAVFLSLVFPVFIRQPPFRKALLPVFFSTSCSPLSALLFFCSCPHDRKDQKLDCTHASA